MMYHYVLVLKAHLGGRDYAEFETRDTLTLDPGTSRREVYEQLRADMIDQARQQGVEGGVPTVFWSLEPDELS